MVQKTDLVQLRGGFRPVQAGAQLEQSAGPEIRRLHASPALGRESAGPDGNIAKASGLPCGKDNEDDQDNRIRDVDRPIGRKRPR